MLFSVVEWTFMIIVILTLYKIERVLSQIKSSLDDLKDKNNKGNDDNAS